MLKRVLALLMALCLLPLCALGRMLRDFGISLL